MKLEANNIGDTLVISPIGDCNPAIFEPLGRELGKIFGYQTETASLLDNVEFAFDSGRGQYHSTPILEKLAGLAPPHTLKVLAITRVDLFIPILTHVYGEAQLGGKASIISTYRLSEGLPSSTEDSYTSRVIKEAVHELGHTFKLLHCKDNTCIMHYCRSIKDVDRKSNQLCRYCKVLLNDEIKRLANIY
ncbi:MAG: archaemetzincin family Zn-dependent metalloprotease [Desulfobacteraceae bacterium]|nr:archaemetzincin family Zn-dependent metalloprotease [Desulfobacteraceae bacterium]